VQVGDPFMEKLLLEACLEVMKADAVVGVQDMGAAGLTCATSETGTRGGVGIEIDIALVPQRETGMTPYEILLSESQERMLLIVKRGREAEVEQIFEKWDLHAVQIGQVTADAMLRVRDRETVVAEVPTRALTDEAPVYRRPLQPPADLEELRTLPAVVRQPLSRPNDALLALLASPTVASKRWIYEQYDYMVRTNTIVAAGVGAGVVRVKGTTRALAMSLDGNGRFCRLDPRLGAQLALAEAARNVACAGAMPIGATNCLNFGNPERPDIMWQFAEAVAGLGEACRALEIPITGGNVSLYNETDGRAILPTPVIGVVGLLSDASRVRGRVFPGDGLEIVQFGTGAGELGGSEFLKTMHGVIRGVPPGLDLARERALLGVLVDLIGRGLLASAHDCAEGGFAVALAECCFEAGGLGAAVSIPGVNPDDGADRLAATLFGESPTRVIAGVAPQDLSAVIAAATRAGVPAARIGRTGGHAIQIAVDDVVVVDVSVSDAEARWSAVLANWLDGRAA
jgi:phosphoribosylformylglycinamidine synthase